MLKTDHIRHGFYTCVDRYGNSLLYRGYDDQGNKVREKIRYRPQLFLQSKSDDTEWKALDGTPVEPMRFDSMAEVRQFEKTYEGVPDFNLYGNTRHIPAFIQSQFPGEINYSRANIDVASLDIETSYGDGFPDVDNPTNEILTLAYKSSKEDRYRVWGLKPYDVAASKLTHLKIEYRQFESEAEMLHDFIDHWSQPDYTPDVITGWNTRFFDIPYLIARSAILLGENTAKGLSPWGKIDRREITIMGRIW